MMYSPGPMDGGETDVRRLEEQLSKLEKLAEELESVPDSGVVEILDQAVALLAEVNARVEAGLASTEGEVRELGDLLEEIDFGPFDTVLENLERPDGSGDG
jgi:phosphoglycerate-specific signal transduction histidine kinase